jgi:hypothetical protein
MTSLNALDVPDPSTVVATEHEQLCLDHILQYSSQLALLVLQ